MTPLMQAALRNALRTSVILMMFAVVGTAMLAFTHDRTEPTITRGRLAEKRALLGQVLPAALYDNDLVASEQSVPPDNLLGTRQPSSLWVARRGGAFSGVVLEAVAPDGYSGDIALLIGIDASGTITGVRVTAHRETPGLGDYIDRAKSVWIDQFAGKSLANPEPQRWRVAKDGGAFDSRAGATVTPRAVVKAVKGALDYFTRQRAGYIAPAPVKEDTPVKENSA
ncbi:MAG: electron transport complex subunit RsxG [Thiobacillus sp.]|uniref:electron transport complex subunit RsxG n=1 Tax=Thiobacillus sp. TaxID=924 RepID=UPI00289495E4|nr:electron transport complex subunit RsxG [Thiobacillus sp.]MDT3707856.1 electron transport complex subunit RsxG [Thiobacillus sp.]